MISQVLFAQIKRPAKGDWYLVVIEDLKTLGLGHLTLEDIASKSKFSMKKLVKEASQKTAFQYLMDKKQGLSKVRDLNYSRLKLQSYLTCHQMNNREKRLTFSLRTRMVNLPSNYGVKTPCTLCEDPATEDNQFHLLKQCTTLQQACPELLDNAVSYEDLFCEDNEKISNVVKLFDIALRKREALLEQRKSS